MLVPREAVGGTDISIRSSSLEMDSSAASPACAIVKLSMPVLRCEKDEFADAEEGRRMWLAEHYINESCGCECRRRGVRVSLGGEMSLMVHAAIRCWSTEGRVVIGWRVDGAWKE